MKSRFLMCFSAITLFAAATMPLRLAAQNEQLPRHELPRYIIEDLGTLGEQLAKAVALTTEIG